MHSFKRLVSIFAVASVIGCSTSPLGRKQLLLVPDSQMNQMGEQAFQQLQQQTPTNSDPKINSYVHCVAEPITQATRGKVDVDQWDIKVFEDPTANAFALPGGKIGVHTGLLKVATTDGQLAAVIGHEIGHVIAKHGAERVSQQTAVAGGSALVNAFLGGGGGGNSNQLVMGLLGLGTQVGLLLPWSRTQESEADIIGQDLMAETGFNPKDSIDLWHNMMAANPKSPPAFLSDHPASEDRVKSLQDHLKESVPKYDRARAEGRAPVCDRSNLRLS